MKNIVVVTWKGGGNYGTCLQSYALNTKLKALGYNVHLCSFVSNNYVIDFFKWCFICLGVKRFLDSYKSRRWSAQEIKRHKFQEEGLDEIKIFTIWQKRKIVSETDCFVSGSDQIWNTYFHFSPNKFLAFAGDKKRVAYASSLGTNSINELYKDEVKKLLSKYYRIGVREEDAVKVLSELTGRHDICQVLDPTFLLTPNEWVCMSVQAKFEIKVPENYLLCYLIGKNERYANELQNVSNYFGIENVIIIPATENRTFSIPGAVVYRDASPVEFVYLIQHASLVCTDSFHATALSINHSVQFVEFVRFEDGSIKSQNSRIYNVLSHYGLMDYIYNDSHLRWTTPIKYESVQRILTSDREKSLDFLISAIES